MDIPYFTHYSYSIPQTHIPERSNYISHKFFMILRPNQDRIYKASELLRQASDMLTEDTNSTLVPNIVAVPASTSIATSISSPVADTMCQIYDGDEFYYKGWDLSMESIPKEEKHASNKRRPFELVLLYAYMDGGENDYDTEEEIYLKMELIAAPGIVLLNETGNETKSKEKIKTCLEGNLE